jgi:hypothetical protein
VSLENGAFPRFLVENDFLDLMLTPSQPQSESTWGETVQPSLLAIDPQGILFSWSLSKVALLPGRSERPRIRDVVEIVRVQLQANNPPGLTPIGANQSFMPCTPTSLNNGKCCVM